MNRIFLSYSHKDASEMAEWLYVRLSGCGYEVFLDHRSLTLGDSFLRAISNAVEQQDFVLVLLSKAALESEWVQKEIDMATVAERRIIPIVLEDLEVPLHLKMIHYLEMKKGTNDWPALHKLVNNLNNGKSIPRVYNMGREDVEVHGALVLGQSGRIQADLNDPQSIAEVAIKLAESALPYIKEAGAGVVPPGHPAVACVVLAHLLGTMNQMPTLFCTHNPGNGKFRIDGGKSISLQNIREHGFAYPGSQL